MLFEMIVNKVRDGTGNRWEFHRQSEESTETESRLSDLEATK